MGDSYISFWTLLCWAFGAFCLLGSIGAVFSGPRQMGTFAGGVMLALLATGGGFVAMGSRSADALDRANRDVARAQANLEALPLTGTESLLASCREAHVVGKASTGGDLVRCELPNGKTITFRMP